ncbi:MAG: rod shape-determining protein [Dysosmobacter sp.]|nr:rod shape-determining protein [Dysosmobacter sp.]
MMGSTAMRGSTLEPWLRELTPARITVLDLKTGGRFTEPSYVAAEYETVTATGRNPATGETRTFSHLALRRYLAAGREALRYEDAPNVLVFSPFRDGQVAQYDGAEFLVRDFLKRIRPGFHLTKPVLCLKTRERTTQVEERALIDLGIQSGGRKVFLFQEPLSALEDGNGSFPGLSQAVVFDILPG